MEQELPRHDELVDERLVLWYFIAALTFMFASMLGGMLMGLQLIAHEPIQRNGAVLARAMADDSHQRDCLRISGECLSGNAALGHSAIDVEAGVQPQPCRMRSSSHGRPW